MKLLAIISPVVIPLSGHCPTSAQNLLPDLVIQNVTLTPPQPVSGLPVMVTATITNIGNAPAGMFVVATSLEPGSVYVAATGNGLLRANYDRPTSPTGRPAALSSCRAAPALSPP